MPNVINRIDTIFKNSSFSKMNRIDTRFIFKNSSIYTWLFKNDEYKHTTFSTNLEHKVFSLL